MSAADARAPSDAQTEEAGPAACGPATAAANYSLLLSAAIQCSDRRSTAGNAVCIFSGAPSRCSGQRPHSGGEAHGLLHTSRDPAVDVRASSGRACGLQPAGLDAGAGGARRAAAPAMSPVERGKMLVIGGGCHDCHTPKKIGPNGPRGRSRQGAVGPPGERRRAGALHGRQGQPVLDPHQRPPDGVERRVGRVLCRQPDAGRDHRHRALVRGLVREGDQGRQAHGRRPSHPAADAVVLVQPAAGRRSEGDLCVPEIAAGRSRTRCRRRPIRPASRCRSRWP